MELASGIDILLLAGGYLSWGFVEYVIHGLLAHRFRTFVSPLHGQHHHEPHAVFTAPLAWMPVAGLVFVLVAAALGPVRAGCFVAGLLVGFARYEYVHWRIHFREPKGERERRLRSHHLAHHFSNPKAYCGVTTRTWDRVFGTLPPTWRDDYARVADRAPLVGPSNFRVVWNPRFAVGRIRSARRRAR